MKKLFAVLVALTLVLSMGTIALAADDVNDGGKITINNALEGATYNIYKMLDFVPSNTAGDKGIYTIEPGWENFFTSEPAANYFTVTENAGEKTVTLKKDVTEVDQIVAQAAIAYAEKNKETIKATDTKTAGGDLVNPEKNQTVTFEGLDLGYYAIDTSAGTMCALTRASSVFNAYEKNEKPDIDKFVQEDSKSANNTNDQGWGKVNDADIDQKVYYKSTITVGYGATNYVMHDTMEKGLTFNNDVVVKLADGTKVDATNYTVTVSPTDGHTFDVAFKNEFIAGLAKGTQFTVYYSATLNENANIVVDGNDNTVYLSYGEDSTWKTNEHKTTTYTWKMDVEKFTKEGENKIYLSKAVFMLLRTKGDENSAIKFKDVTAEGGIPTYMVDPEGDITKIETAEGGKFEIVGLDADTYFLHEKEAPAGYNKLAEDITVEIDSTYNEEGLSATATVSGVNAKGFIEVENKTGSLLPETGGIGTTIFYIVGSVLMVAALVLLVSKKRMAAFA